jgi:hypothetical protein
MEAKHTPGPWRVDSLGVVTGGKAGLTSVCTTTQHQWAQCQAACGMDGKIEAAGFCGEAFESARSNGRLIAAAPELFAALESMIPIFDAFTRDELSMNSISEAMDLLPEARAAIAKAKGE